MKKVVIEILKKALKKIDIKKSEEEIERMIEFPPSQEMGDYSFPCFSLAEELKESPHLIALKLKEEIGNYPQTDLDDVQTIGPYVNFFLDRKNLARQVVWEAINFKEKYGRGGMGERKKIVVEYSSPNIAKPFGIGHLRSTIIGNAIANLCEFQGFDVKRINYLGDWGTQFGKIAYGYKKFGKESALKKNPIKHLLEIYVKINKSKKNEEPSREVFRKMEEGDKESLLLWRIFKDESLKEFKKLYKRMGIKFDVYEGESDYNKKLKSIITELTSKGLLKKSQGALIVDLEKEKLGVSIIQKSDGASIYATRDLAAAISRYKTYKFEKMIYEVGQEQKLHFKQVFKILELMGYDWAKNCVHVDHGLYLGKDKKKYSTRKGKTIFMEDILDQTHKLALKEIKKRFPKLNKTELERRAEKVALAAIFYGDLKNTRTNNIVFDLDRFVSFEGNTGPYILYSYARASSIIRKSKQPGKFEINNLEDKELELVIKLSKFKDTAFHAYKQLSPAIVANYVYETCQLFNEFYHACPVLGSESESFRLALVEAFRQVVKNSMNLLGIELLEEM